MFEHGQSIRHKNTGQIVKFVSLARSHRGVTKINTDNPDFGPIDIRQFEAVDAEDLVVGEPIEEVMVEEDEEDEVDEPEEDGLVARMTKRTRRKKTNE